MVEREDMRDEITSGEAGWTLSRFAAPCPGALLPRDGRDWRRRDIAEGLRNDDAGEAVV